MSELAQSWLEEQCRSIPGVSGGLVSLAVNDGDDASPVACWPGGSTPSGQLAAAARQAMRRGRPVVLGQKTAGEGEASASTIAYPLLSGERAIGVVAVEVSESSSIRQQDVIGLLKLGSTLFEMLLAQQHAENRTRLKTVLELVALALDQDSFQQAATSIATQLAIQLSCSRVSIGFLRGNHVTVRALSHSARHGVKTNLLRDIAIAMEEAIDQDAALVWPGDQHVNHAHRKLAKRNNDAAVCTLPLVNDGRFIGAITFERHDNVPFDSDTVDLYSHVAALIGPVLELKHRNDRWLIVRFMHSVADGLHKLFGPRHVVLKLATLTLAAVLIFMSVAQGPYRVTAQAALEGSVQRAVVAPVDGFITESSVRAGDIVEAGQLLGAIDDRDLDLEHRRLSSEKARYSREYRGALAEHDRAQVAILNARISQADAELQLIEQQLERMQIQAPFTGVVVSGDLSQSLGSPVQRGDVLFEVAPLDAWRLILEVDEHDMQAMQIGQAGKLKLAGLPGKTLDFTVSRITPVSEAADGSNYFRIEAELADAPEILRPGMAGVGKIEIDQRRQLWIWTHRMLDWFRLKTWSWLP
ncbi:MAG: HlyD family efflux transporter periplasmic adaptor subunit [Gammaproteobacteria bacterium]